MTANSQPIRVLFVEGDGESATAIADRLEQIDDRLTVQSVTSAAAAITVVETDPIDCIVSEYRLPRTDGVAFLESVRDRFGDIPFILFTDDGSEVIASEAITAGVTTYLRRSDRSDPVADLADRVVTAVGRKRELVQYEAIVENATDGIVVHDPGSEAIVAVNERFAAMMGGDRETLRGQSLDTVFVDGFPATLEGVVDRLRQTAAGEATVFESMLEPWSGPRIPVEVTLTRVVIDGQDRVLASVRDIADRRGHEQALAALHDVARELVTCESPDAVYQVVVETAEDLIDCDYVIADAVEGETLIPRAEAPGSVGDDPSGVPIDVESNVASRAYRRGQSVLVDDIHGPEGVPSDSEYAAVLSVPIGDHGVFQAAARDAGAFDDQDRELAELLVSHATAALDRLATIASRRSERQRLVGLFRNLPAATVEYEMVEGEPIVQAVNPAFEAVFGYDETSVSGQPLDKFVVPPASTEEADRLNEQVAAGERLDVEVRRSTTEGVRTFRLVNAPIERGDDSRQRGYAIYRDITDREETRLRLEAVVTHADQAIYIKDLDGRYELVNDACAALFDATPAEIEGKHDAELFPASELERIARKDREVVETGEALTYEREVTINGENRLLRNQKYPFVDGSGTIAGVVGISTDVTDRRARQRRMEALSAAFPDVAFIVDETGRHVEVLASPASEALLSLDPAELVGKRFTDLFDDEQAAAFQDLIDRTLATGELQTMEYQLDVQRGTRWFETRTTPLATELEGKQAVAWVARDITERKRREEELQRQRDRLDEFAAVVSHDLRNPLNIAAGNLELARDEVDNDHLEAVGDALERMEALVETLLAVAKRREEEPELDRVSLQRFAQTCWADIDTGEATLDVRVDRTVMVDPPRLRQLFENLYRNSIEHGGETVQVRVGDLDNGFYVEDDGSGIPPSDREQVVAAGVSGNRDGTGFGLSIVAQVADDHGWTLTLTDSDTGGARFEFRNVDARDS